MTSTSLPSPSTSSSPPSAFEDYTSLNDFELPENIPLPRLSLGLYPVRIASSLRQAIPPQRSMGSSNSVRHAHIIGPNSVVWLDDPDSPAYRSRALLLQIPILAQQPWKSPLLDGGTWKIGQARAMCQAWDGGHGLHGTIWHGVYKRHALPTDLEYLSMHYRQRIPRKSWELFLSDVRQDQKDLFLDAIGGGSPQPTTHSSSTSTNNTSCDLVEEILQKETFKVPLALVYFDRQDSDSLHAARMHHMWLGYRQNLLVIERNGTVMFPDKDNVDILERVMTAENNRDAWKVEAEEQDRGLEELIHKMRSLESGVSESGRKKPRTSKSIGTNHGALTSPDSRINAIPSRASDHNVQHDQHGANFDAGLTSPEDFSIEDSDERSSV
ncbi:hypothetical protein FS837_007979, partial [Tulasnella sp. UAMH 9824]